MKPWRLDIRRRWRSAPTAVRLALIQAAVVVAAFAVAGYMAHLSIGRLNELAIRDRVTGEAASLADELALRGAGHLPHTVAKRSRQWRGFQYRLVGPDGRLEAGALPSPPGGFGWSRVRPPVGGAGERFLVLTERLRDGSVLSTGQALASGDAQMAAVNSTLLACGALGAVFCVAATYLFTRRDWLRIAAVAQAAHAVSSGHLDVRVPLKDGAPRDDMDEMAQTFNTMLDRIGDLLRQVRQVSTDIAHDLRTPLTRLRQKIERLTLDARADPALLAAIRGLDGEVIEILRTFDALLQLSEIEASGLGSRARPVAVNDLAEIAGRVADAFRPDIEESGRSLAVQLETVLARCDGRLLAQAIANLLENALRHTPPGSSIAVRVAAEGGQAVVTVDDDGPGIPAAETAAVLKPFVRLEPSRRMPGFGLGLSIVAAVAARHQAQLSLEDAHPGLRVRLAFVAERAAPRILESAPCSPVAA